MTIEQIIQIASGAEPMAVSNEFARAIEMALVTAMRPAGEPPARTRLAMFGAPMSMLAAGVDNNSGAVGVTNAHAESEAFSVLYTRVPAGQPPRVGEPGSVAVIDVFGPLMATDGEVSDDEGNRWGTSYSFIRKAVHSARADPEVKAILTRYDSPGGAAIGMHPASAELFDMAHGDGQNVSAGSGFKAAGADGRRKPIVAYADRLMASAALGLGVQANAVLVSPAAITGSIGTIMSALNIAGLLDRHGIKIESFKNPAHKDAGSPYRPISEDDRRRLQGTIDTLAEMFVADVGRGRRVERAQVKAWQDQMTFVGDQAVKAGLADGKVVNVEQAIRAAAAMADG